MEKYSRKETILKKHGITESEYNDLFKDGTLCYEDIAGVRMVKILKPIVKKQKPKEKPKRRL